MCTGDGRIGVESEVLKKKKTCGRIVIKKKMWRPWRHSMCGFGYVVEKSMTCDIEGGKEKGYIEDCRIILLKYEVGPRKSWNK